MIKGTPDLVDRPLRTSGVAMKYDGDDLIVWGPHMARRYRLNPSAATVWLFSDGQLTIEQMGEWLVHLMPEQAAEITDDLPGIVADLHRSGLLDLTQSQTTPRPLLRVGFLSFWPGFVVEDNYFLWMLSKLCDLLVVDPKRGNPDILFYSSFPSVDFGHNPDQNRTIRIYVGLHSEENTKSNYELLLQPGSTTEDSDYGPADAKTGGTELRFGIPLWSVYLDWNRLEQAYPVPDSYLKLSPHHPDAVGHRILEAIFGSESIAHSVQQRREPGFSPVMSAIPTVADSDTCLSNQSVQRTSRPTVTKTIPHISRADSTPQMLCILGMHRSGTSCLTGSLREAGLYLGDVVTHTPDNVKGELENRAIRNLHDQILMDNGGSWHHVPEEVHWDDRHRIYRDHILERYPHDRPVGFKDPRTVLLFSGWLEVLPDMRFVGTFRNPIAVAASLTRRNSFSLEEGLRLWLAYNRRLLTLQEEHGFPLISFDWPFERYLAHVDRIADWCGLPGPRDGYSFADEALRHHHRSPNTSLPEPVADLFMRLNKAAFLFDGSE